MGASKRPYPEGFRLGLRCRVTRRKVRATSVQKVSASRVDVVGRVEAVEKTVVLVFHPDSISFLHTAIGWKRHGRAGL